MENETLKKSTNSFNQELVGITSHQSSEKDQLQNADAFSKNEEKNYSPLINDSPPLSQFQNEYMNAEINDEIIFKEKEKVVNTQMKQKVDTEDEQDKVVNIFDEESSIASDQNLKGNKQLPFQKSKFSLQKSKQIQPQQDSKIQIAVTEWKKQNLNILFKRKLFRILLLIGIEAVIIALVIAFFNTYGYNRGSLEINQSDTILIEVNKFTIKVIDIEKRGQFDLNYLTNMDIPSSIDGDILMTYSFPDKTVMKNDHQIVNLNTGVKKISLKNSANFQSCQIVLYVYKAITLNNLTINCLEKECDIFIDSTNLKFSKLQISGPQIQLNSPNLIVNDLNFSTFQGNFEASNFEFITASIDISEGDISIQSLKSIKADVELANKLYCISTYTNTLITDGVVNNPNNCSEVYGYGVIKKDPKYKIASRCYKGTISIPSNIPGAAQSLTAKNTFGNLFINILQSKGQAADQVNTQFVFDKAIYGLYGDDIKFSQNSQQEFNKQLKMAKNPNIYDPIFIIKFGTSLTETNTYSQWQLTYNPAYSYFKPWWLGTLTVGLLNSQKFEAQYVLAPGFCPYVNSLNQKRLNNINNLLKDQFASQKNSDNFILTLSWQSAVDLPPFNFEPANYFSGIREVSFKDNYQDDWLRLSENNDGTLTITNLTLSQHNVLEAAVIVSIVLAFIVGLVLIVGIVYVINVNYIYLLEHISNTDMYSKISKAYEDQNIGPLLRDEEIQVQGGDLENKQKITEIKQSDVIQIQYTVQGLINIFSNLISLSPPLSAYIDQVVLLFQKARTNSIQEFYQLLFKEVQKGEKGQDDVIHNLDKDSILGSEMKGLYEQYCYLNKLLERKLDEEDGINLALKKGFKIVKKYDALIQSYSYIKFNGKILSISTNQNKSSLELFIESSCTLTKFESDSIDSISFEQYYNDFCLLNHIPKQPISEGQLQRDFGIETKYDPLQVLERDPNYDLKIEEKMYVIDKKRVQNTFKLLCADNLQDEVFKTQEMQEVKQEIYAPNFWWFYDTLTVLAHLGSVLLLGCPIIILVIFVRIQQSSYSSVPIQRLLQKYDLLEQPSSIPYKLMSDDDTSEAIAIITAIFLVLSSWDLIYYYTQMYIPQERYFQNYNKSGFIRKTTSKIMWIIVLIILYMVTIYLSLVGTWLILSAIINPEAFLPYATSAATFVTLVTKKYQQFKYISENGIKLLTDYLKGIAQQQFKDILNKMDLGGKIQRSLPTDQMKGLCAEAAALGIIDPKQSESIQDNIEIMVRDPDAVAHLGKDILAIAQDPRQFTANLMSQLEEKAKQQLEQQIKQYLPIMAKSLTQLLFSILTNKKMRLKAELGIVLSDISQEIQTKSKEQIDPKIMKQLEILQGPVLRLIFECIQQNPSLTRKEQIDIIIQQFSALIASLVLAKYPFIEEKYNKAKQNDNKQQQQQLQSTSQSKKTGFDFKQILQTQLKKVDNFKEKITEKVIENAYKNIFQGIQRIFTEFEKKSIENMLKEFIKILSEFQLIPAFESIRELSQFTELLSLIGQISMSLKTLSRNDILRMIKKFIQDSKFEDKFDFCQFNIINLIEFIILIVGGYNQEQKTPEVSYIKELFTSIIKDVQKPDIDIKTHSSLVAFTILGFRSNLQNIPTDVIKDVFEFIYQQTKNEGESNNLNAFLSILLDNQGGGKGNFSQQKLIIMQDFFSLQEKLFNNTQGQIENLQINSKRVYGISNEFSSFFLNILQCNNRNLMSVDDWQTLISTKYFQQIAQRMKMQKDDLHGLILFILNQTETPQCLSFLRMIFNQYKIDEQYIKTFNHLMNFVASSDDASLHQSFKEFGLDKEIYFKSNKEQKFMSYNDCKFMLLFLRGKYEYQYCEVRINDLISKKLLEDKNKNVNLQNNQDDIKILSTNVINSIKSIEFTSQALNYMVKNISNGSITHLQVVQLVKHLNIKEGQLDQNTINLFGKLIALRNLNFGKLSSTSNVLKEQSQNIASIINLDEKIVQTFLQLILCPDDKIFESLIEVFHIPIQGLNYSQFISHCVSTKKEMEDYSNQIAKINNNLFQNKIPIELLKSIAVDMEIPNTTEIIYFLLQLTNKQAPKKILSFIKFVFNTMTDLQKDNYVKQILLSQTNQTEENSLGLKGLINIFTNPNSSINLQIFLQYLLDQNKELILLIACFFTYFDGKSEGIKLRIKDSSQQTGILKMSIEQYLAKQLDIKIEFFQALPAIFSSDLLQFSSSLIKLFRQIDYQEQKLLKQVKSQNKSKINSIFPSEKSHFNEEIVKEIMDKHLKNVNQVIKIDNLQENFVNNVTISEKEVEQYIKLVQGQAINTSFFSRELQISLDVVEFLQFINSLKTAKSGKSRNLIFEEMKNNSSVIAVLRAIKIDLNDLKNCIKLMYQKIEISEASQLQQALNLPQTFPIQVLQDLMLLDMDVDDYTDIEKSRKILSNTLHQNRFHQSLKIKSIWSSLAFCLTQDYILLEACYEKNKILQLATSGNSQIQAIFQGLIGIIQKKKTILLPEKIFKDIYRLITEERRQSEQFQNINEGENEDFDGQQNNTQEQIQIEKSNTFEYALFLMYKETGISSVWTLLMSGDINTWDYYILRYYYTNKYTNTPYLSPVMAVMLILQLRQTPTILKEIISYLELYLQMIITIQQNVGDLQKNPNINITIDQIELINEVKQKISLYLENMIIRDADKQIPIKCFNFIQQQQIINRITEIAQSLKFPLYILKTITEEEYNCIKDQNEKIFYKDKNINKIFDKVVKENKEYFKKDFREYIYLLYTNVDENCFKQQQILKKQSHLESSLHQAFDQNPIIHLLLISSLTQLQDSYYFIFHYTDRGYDHARQVSFVIDFILSTIDIFYFFKLEETVYQKFYMFPLLVNIYKTYFINKVYRQLFQQNIYSIIFDQNYYLKKGMACGFNLDGADIKNSSPTASLVDEEFIQQLKQDKQSALKLKVQFMAQKIKSMENTISLFIPSIKEKISQSEKQEDSQKPIVKMFSKDIESCIRHSIDPVKGKAHIMRLIEEYDYFIQQNYLISSKIKKFQFILNKSSFYTDLNDKEFFHLKSLTPQTQSTLLAKLNDEDLKSEQQQYLEFVESPNTTTLLGFFKCDYECLNNNAILQQQYQQEIKFLVGILQMHGSLCSSFTQEIDSQMFNNFISQSTQYMGSQKKSILQILSLFFESIESDLSTISDAMNVNAKVLNSLAAVFLNNSRYDSKDMNTLLSLTNYSQVNKEQISLIDDVIKKIIDIYNGQLDSLMELTKFSTQFQYSEAYKILYQFLYSIDNYSISSVNKDPRKINMTSLIFFSPNITENKLKIQKKILKLCKEIIRKQVIVAQQKNINKQFTEKYQFLFGNEYDLDDGFMISSINSITENNWRFLFTKDVTNLNLFLNQAFNLSDRQAKLFKVFSIFKPNLLRFTRAEINKYVKDEDIQKGFEVLQEFQLLEKGIRREYFDLILGITNQRGFLALDALLELQEASKVFGVDQSLIGDLSSGQTKVQNSSKINENIHITLILRSIYLWKKISATQFDVNDCPLPLIKQILECLTFLIGHLIDILQSKTNNNQSTANSFDSTIFTFKNLSEKFNEFIKYGRNNNQYLDDLDIIANQDKTSFLNVYKSFFTIYEKSEQIGDKFLDNSICNAVSPLFFGQIYYALFSANPSLDFIKNVIMTFQFQILDETLENIFMQEDQNGFIFQIFQKDGRFNETSKNFAKFLYFFTRILLIFQQDSLSQSEKNTYLIKEFYQILEVSHKIVTGKEIPPFLNKAISILLNNKTEEIDDLMKEIINFLTSETDLKAFLGIQKDNPQVSEKFFILFKLLSTIFNSPAISLQDETVVQSFIQVLQIAGEDYISKQLIQGIIGLIQGDLKSIIMLISYFNLINQNDAKAIEEMVNSIQKLAIFSKNSSLQQINAPIQPVLDDQMKDLLKRLQEGNVNIQDIFRTLVNQEGQNGMISIDSFCTFLSRTGIQLSQHRTNEIFAMIKKLNKQTNTQLQSLLSEEEFVQAFEYVTNKKISMSLEKLGISGALLALSLGTLIVILILLFVFIFLGIQAFTLGGTFGAIINSIIPMGAATGTAASQEDKSQKLQEKNIKNVIKETEFILHSKQL